MKNEKFVNESETVKEIIKNSKDEEKAKTLVKDLLNEFSNSKFKRQPKKFLTKEENKTMELVEKGEISIKESLKIMNICRTTFYKYKKIRKEQENGE